MSFSKFLLFLLLTFSLQAYSYTTTKKTYNTTVVLPSNITYDNQVYEVNPSGFRSFIDENFKDSKPKFYRKLNRYVSDLESKSFISKTSLWGGTGVGLLIALKAASDIGNCEIDDRGCKDSAEQLSNLSTVIMLGGLVGYYIYNPSREDYMKVINIHNRDNKNKPIDLKLGIAPVKDGAKLALNFRF